MGTGTRRQLPNTVDNLILRDQIEALATQFPFAERRLRRICEDFAGETIFRKGTDEPAFNALVRLLRNGFGQNLWVEFHADFAVFQAMDLQFPDPDDPARRIALAEAASRDSNDIWSRKAQL